MSRFQLDTGKQWDNEPDFVDIEGKAYHLVVNRSHMGNLNGYVGVKRQHPWFGLHYDDNKLRNIEVHGGLTYSNKAEWEGMKKKYWYFGFDTAHAWDIVPQLEEMKKMHGLPDFEELFPSFGSFFKSTYKDLNFVSNEVNDLFEQIKQVKDKNPDYKYNFRKEYKRLGKIIQREKRHMDILKSYSK